LLNSSPTPKPIESPSISILKTFILSLADSFIEFWRSYSLSAGSIKSSGLFLSIFIVKIDPTVKNKDKNIDINDKVGYINFLNI
jgi:hypothetical protein